jgi:hypothetical protein
LEQKRSLRVRLAVAGFLAEAGFAAMSYGMTHIVALYTLAVLLGGMVFFASVMAPLVFTRLPPMEAGRFIRAVFPWYYLFVLINAALAAVALLPQGLAAVMAGVAVVTAWLRWWLMPRLNRWSDAAQAGDGAAKRRFDRGHRLSVWVNMLQVLAVGWALWGVTL